MTRDEVIDRIVSLGRECVANGEANAGFVLLSLAGTMHAGADEMLCRVIEPLMLELRKLSQEEIAKRLMERPVGGEDRL